LGIDLREIRERGLRTWLNENPRVATAAAGLLIGLAVIFISVQLIRACSGPSLPSYSAGEVMSWYATEDGQDLYADDATLVPPFEKGGKTFYRAYVYQCPNGDRFVNHIEMYPPESRQKMEQIRAKSSAPLHEYTQFRATALIKRPGGKTWFGYKDMSSRTEVQTPRGKSCQGDQAVPVAPPKE
jgi:hypothetical protein